MGDGGHFSPGNKHQENQGEAGIGAGELRPLWRMEQAPLPNSSLLPFQFTCLKKTITLLCRGSPGSPLLTWDASFPLEHVIGKQR